MSESVTPSGDQASTTSPEGTTTPASAASASEAAPATWQETLGDFSSHAAFKDMGSHADLAKAHVTLLESTAVPEAYQAEGVEPAILERYQQDAREMGLTQAQFEKYVATEKKAEQTRLDNMTKWEADAKTQFGAEFQTTIDMAAKTLKAIGNPTVVDALHRSGLGSHPDVLRMFATIGKMISEDTLVRGSGNGGKEMERTEGGTPLLNFKM